MPQKTLGSLPCPIVSSVQIVWLPRGSTFSRAHGRGVAQLGYAAAGHLSWVETGTNQMGWLSTNFSLSLQPQPDGCQTSPKGFRRFIGHAVSHDVITSPCQLMGYGFPCQGRVIAALRQLALVKALGFGLKAHGKLRRFHIGPRQIRMAISDIARPFAFAIADLRAVHTAAIRSIVPHTGKTADRPGFQGNCLSQDR